MAKSEHGGDYLAIHLHGIEPDKGAEAALRHVGIEAVIFGALEQISVAMCLKARPALAPMQGHVEVARVRCIKPLNLSGDANVHTHGGAR